MSDSPASGIMAAPHLPWHGGACGAVNTPAPPFYSARREQRSAEQAQRVGDRWTVGWTVQRAEADAVRANEGAPAVSLPIPDAVSPTLCRHVDTERDA